MPTAALRAAIGLLLGVCLLVLGGDARGAPTEENEDAEKEVEVVSSYERAWIRRPTEGSPQRELLRVQVTSTGRFYASGRVSEHVPDDDEGGDADEGDAEDGDAEEGDQEGDDGGGTDVITHLKRDPQGRLRKYRREFDVRKGSGLFFFKREGGFHVATQPAGGVTSVGGSLDGGSLVVWDPEAWHWLEGWVDRLQGAGEEAEIAVLDVPGKRVTRTVVQRGRERSVIDGRGLERSVRSWIAYGVGDGRLVLYLDDRGKLAGARMGEQRMLREGWSWKASRPDDDADADAGSDGDADAEAGASGEGGDASDGDADAASETGPLPANATDEGRDEDDG